MGLRQSPKVTQPTVGCGIETGTESSANNKRWGRDLSRGGRFIVSAYGKLAFPSIIQAFALRTVTQNSAHVSRLQPALAVALGLPTD